MGQTRVDQRGDTRSQAADEPLVSRGGASGHQRDFFAILATDVSTHPSQALPAVNRLEPDPELLALPAPPKRERGITVATMALTALAAALLAWSLRSEARYALTSGAPTSVGDFTKLTLDDAMKNRYVEGSALLGTQGAIRYGRAAESDTFRLAPVAGNPKLFVEIRVPEGFEGPRFIPPRSFAGRLVPFSESGLRHAGLSDAIAEKGNTQVPPDAWIVIDGSSPRASRWALMLVVLFGAFALWNAIGVVRLLARVKDGESPPPGEGATTT